MTAHAFTQTLQRKNYLANRLAGERRSKEVEIKFIQEQVALFYSIAISDLLSRRRRVHEAWPRQVAMHFCRELTGFNLEKIADGFLRDHGTIMHACVTVKETADVYPEIAAELVRLKAILIEGLKHLGACARPS